MGIDGFLLSAGIALADRSSPHGELIVGNSLGRSFGSVSGRASDDVCVTEFWGSIVNAKLPAWSQLHRRNAVAEY